MVLSRSREEAVNAELVSDGDDEADNFVTTVGTIQKQPNVLHSLFSMENDYYYLLFFSFLFSVAFHPNWPLCKSGDD